jgi:pyruvate/2-oxoglutarate dehydrogenase complex dihydrolipoamide dehydrogenase (E3) component
MAEIERYDNLIIGSGESGKYLAWTLAKSGQRTAVVERRFVGGSCPNIACLPSKNLIHSAKVASLVRRGGEFGVETGPVRADMRGVQRRRAKMVEVLIQEHLERYRASGAELIMGEASFTGAKTVDVRLNAGGVRTIAGNRVFLNVGTRATIPNIAGLSASRPMTHLEALELDRLPGHLVVLGGGYVGLELAQAFRRFGAPVTVIERGPQLASHEDPEFGEHLARLFLDEGIEVLFNTHLRQIEGLSSQDVRITLEDPKGARSLHATDLLIATGRTANTNGLGLEKAGIELNAHGFIWVSNRLETTAPGVWAMGDCAGSPQFTHVAFDDFRIVRDNLAGGNRTTRNRLVPFCMFTDPELARVGLNETQAKAAGISYRVTSIPMAAVLRTRTISEPRGLLKVLVDTGSDRILGFTGFGAEASELMAAVQTAMLGGLPYTTLRDAIYTHPTVSEGLNMLLASLPPRG